MRSIKYFFSRHWINIAIAVIVYVSAWLLGYSVMLMPALQYTVGAIFQVVVGVSLILLITKYAYPKLHIQDTIKNDPIALAIFTGSVVIAIALLF